MKTAFLLFFAALAAFAQDPIRYTLRFPQPHTHYISVEAVYPANGPTIEIYMPVWTPGSYLVREYEGQVDQFQAKSPTGQPLQWEKTRKNRWLIQTGGAKSVTVRYHVYANEPSVQGNFVDAGFAMLNGAPTFMTLEGNVKRRHEVRLEPPPAWKKSISGLKPLLGEHAYVAENFDELVDSPIYAGNAPIYEFEAGGKKHFLVNEGEGPMWDGPASAQDVKKVVEGYLAMWGSFPYDRYVFFNMLIEQGGGLEHLNSTWMNASRWAYGNTEEPQANPAEPTGQRRRPSRAGWLGLASHEYFHLWNVKRLRPAALGPFNYEEENYTKSLWIAEGLTSYYGELNLSRTGLLKRDQYLRSLSRAINQLQTTPGRLVETLSDSSYDTWIKFYRRNENSPNTVISYYTKGQVAGFVLDARIRKLTNNAKSLDDVMRLAYERYSGEKGYTPEQFVQVASEVAGSDLSPWFDKALNTTEELGYTEALAWYGLRFRPNGPNAPPRLNTGITTRNDAGRLVISEIRSGTPGYSSGLNVNDEILAVNDIRVTAEQWPARLDSYKSGESVKILVARRGQLTTLPLEVIKEAPPAWNLEVLAAATDQQKANLKAWLGQ